MADSSYTAIATVVTQGCPSGAKGYFGELSLPRVDEQDEEMANKLNEMMQQIEDRFNLLNKSDPITGCITNGSIVIDCSHGDTYEIDVTEDINSITFKNCIEPGTEYDINFRNTGVSDFTIAGWPLDTVCAGCGNALNPTIIEPGVNLRRNFRTNKHGKPIEKDDVSGSEGGHPGGGGGGQGDSGSDALDDCACIVADPLLRELTVKVCTALDCDDDEPKLELEVCGGAPPYTWSTSGGEGSPTLVVAGLFDWYATVTPPDKTTVGGTAYRSGFEITRSGGGCACTCSEFQYSEPFGCEDQSLGSCAQSALGSGTFPINCEDDTLGDCGLYPNSTPGDPCDNCARSGVVDLRTQQMKDDGCLPCQLSMDGVEVTVTDDDGVSVVTIISL